ncbi:hypothetical protein BC941DRAFT_505161 [Chlamydoabsidia padenii]|nr:hypothetical protein BC941DRAFT_505161 [Chlamydoabsidia padenii]
MFMGTLLFVFLYCYLASMFIVSCGRLGLAFLPWQDVGDIVSCSTPGSAGEWVVLVKRDVCYGAPFDSWGWIMMCNVYGYFMRLGLALSPWQDVGDIVSCSTPGSAGEWVVLVKRDVCYGAPFDSWGWIMMYNVYGYFMVCLHSLWLCFLP